MPSKPASVAGAKLVETRFGAGATSASVMMINVKMSVAQ
jgi:hypothetical protein